MGKNSPYSLCLTDKEFYTMACRYADTKSVQTAAKWWRAFNEVFVHELHYKDSCRLPNVGTFSLRYVKSSKQTQRNPNGKMVTYKVPERYVPIFTSHDTFINDVNYQGVTKAYRKRLKNNALTQRDYDRVLRSESEEGKDKISLISEEDIEESKNKFIEALKEKNNKFKEKIKLEEED